MFDCRISDHYALIAPVSPPLSMCLPPPPLPPFTVPARDTHRHCSRTPRLSLLSRSDLFVFVYDEQTSSVSDGVELGYWLAKLENEPHGGAHTLVLLTNTTSTTLLKMLPETTYILLDDASTPDDQVNPDHAQAVNVKDFPNLITVRSLDELSGAFADVLRAMEAWPASEPPGLGLSLPKHKDQMQWMLPR